MKSGYSVKSCTHTPHFAVLFQPRENFKVLTESGTFSRDKFEDDAVGEWRRVQEVLDSVDRDTLSKFGFVKNQETIRVLRVDGEQLLPVLKLHPWPNGDYIFQRQVHTILTTLTTPAQCYFENSSCSIVAILDFDVFYDVQFHVSLYLCDAVGTSWNDFQKLQQFAFSN